MGYAVKINSQVEYWQLNSDKYFKGDLPKWAYDAIQNKESLKEIEEGCFDILVPFGDSSNHQYVQAYEDDYLVWDKKLGVFPVYVGVFEQTYAKVN